MNWRSPHLLILLLIVCVVLVLSGMTLAFYLTHRETVSTSTTHAIPVDWMVSTTAFTQQDQQAIEKAIQDTIAAQSKDVPRPSEIDIITSQREGDWATFTTQQKTSNSEVLSTEPGFFIAHRQGSSWSLLLPGTSGFCDQLKQVPNTLLAPIDKRYFCQS